MIGDEENLYINNIIRQIFKAEIKLIKSMSHKEAVKVT